MIRHPKSPIVPSGHALPDAVFDALVAAVSLAASGLIDQAGKVIETIDNEALSRCRRGSGNKIVSLAPLSGLPRLYQALFARNLIDDVVMTDVPRLAVLLLEANQIKDLSGLAQVTTLVTRPT